MSKVFENEHLVFVRRKDGVMEIRPKGELTKDSKLLIAGMVSMVSVKNADQTAPSITLLTRSNTIA